MILNIRRPILIGFLICWVACTGSLSWAGEEQKKENDLG